MPDIKFLLKNYLDYLELERGRAVKTRENYERYLRHFLAKSGIRTEKDITLDKVRQFRLALARIGLKRATQNYYIIALRNFLKYLAKNDYPVLQPEKIELPKVPERQIEIINPDALERLLKAPGRGNLRGLRDRAILETFFSTGLRLSEICSLNRYIDLDKGEISVRGKGGKLRLVFLSPRAQQAIREYLAARGDTLECLFPSYRGRLTDKKTMVLGPIRPRTIQRLINFYARRAGVSERVTPHSLRHLFATDLLLGGADLRSVQKLLGHSNIATTQVYTHVTDRELKEIHRAIHGLSRD